MADSLTEGTDSYGNVFPGTEKKMGKANFSHLASQNILLLIVLVIIIFLPSPEVLAVTS